MTKKNKTPLGIFMESVGLYFSNIVQFAKYMTFPVLGQILGLILIFSATYLYAQNIPQLMLKYSILNNFNLLVAISVIVTLPGLVIFMKAFWEYLVAYGAINSMLENMLKSGRVYDFDAHTELIKRRTPSYIVLWLLVGIFSLLAIVPIFWIPAGVLAVYFVLVFQVYTYEPELSPIGVLRKSLLLVKGHFLSTFMLLALVGALTYCLIPQIINMICEMIKITEFLSKVITPLVSALPIAELNKLIAYAYLPPLKIEMITGVVVTSLISQIFIQYTLPMRSLLWGMWYRELNANSSNNDGEKRKYTKKSNTKSKRPSEVLMEASHKKYGTNKSIEKNTKSKSEKYQIKKIDRNILRRAMEKDDE